MVQFGFALARVIDLDGNSLGDCWINWVAELCVLMSSMQLLAMFIECVFACLGFWSYTFDP